MTGLTCSAIEGEGDGSLEFWREGHWRFFSRACARIRREPTLDMPVVCTVFELLASMHRSAPQPCAAANAGEASKSLSASLVAAAAELGSLCENLRHVQTLLQLGEI
jgi:hypothetical protein